MALSYVVEVNRDTPTAASLTLPHGQSTLAAGTGVSAFPVESRAAPGRDCIGHGRGAASCSADVPSAGGDVRVADTHPGDPEHLFDYWAHGKGALKIRWGQPGDFNRCVLQLSKYAARGGFDPHGLCNRLHRRALGAPPGKGHG